MPDPYLKIHDIRYLRPLSPIPFPSPPTHVKFHPRLQSTVIVATGEGRVQTLDINDIANSSVAQVETQSYVTSMAVAPTGDGLALSDADGLVHLFSTGHGADFCRYEGELEMPDPIEPLPLVDWREDTPLHLIGMPYYDQPLLSQMPRSFDLQPSAVHHMRQKIDPAVLAGAKQVDFVGYAPYPPALRAGQRRNQVPRTPAASKSKRRMAVPMFRSEKERRGGREKDEGPEDEANGNEMPKYYRKVEIQYSRFGIEDFDFECVPVLCESACVHRHGRAGSTTRQGSLASRRTSPTRTRTRCSRRCIAYGH